MQIPTNQRLLRLSESGLTVDDPHQDVRHRKVIDNAGEDVGTIQDLFIDEHERKVRFLLVASGGFLGLGRDHILIPIDAVTRVEGDRVHIDQNRDRLAEAPVYNPDLAEEHFDAHFADVYGFYGVNPYWGPGYVYPVGPWGVP